MWHDKQGVLIRTAHARSEPAANEYGRLRKHLVSENRHSFMSQIPDLSTFLSFLRLYQYYTGNTDLQMNAHFPRQNCVFRPCRTELHHGLEGTWLLAFRGLVAAVYMRA